jgi:hypothetical protein
MTSASARATQGWISQHGGNGSILNLSLQEDEVYASGSAVSQAAQEGLMDVQSLDSDGFTLIMDDAETAASLITYLAWGDAVVVAPPSRQTGPRTVLRAVPRASYF